MMDSAPSKGRPLQQPQEPTTPPPELRDLVPLVAGGKLFAVFSEDADGIAENKPVAALPHAPAAVLGVACVRGRMLTVLDPVVLCTGESVTWQRPLPYVVVLRGDEQLALAADVCRDAITIATADISSEHDDRDARPAVLGVVRHAGEQIIVLNVEDLFAAAMQRRERRRRRL